MFDMDLFLKVIVQMTLNRIMVNLCLIHRFNTHEILNAHTLQLLSRDSGVGHPGAAPSPSGGVSTSHELRARAGCILVSCVGKYTCISKTYFEGLILFVGFMLIIC